MSDDHRAAIPMLSLSRQDSVVRAATRLRDHGLAFDGDIRGLHWDHELRAFSYDDEEGRDLEGLDSVEAAIEASRAWECVCLDFSGMSSSWELHALQGRSASESGIALILPHSLYRLGSAEIPTARRLIHLFDEVRRVVGAELLICGTQVPEPALPLAELTAFVDQQLRNHLPTALALHTIVGSASFYEALRLRHALGDYWRHLELPDGAHGISQLPIDK